MPRKTQQLWLWAELTVFNPLERTAIWRRRQTSGPGAAIRCVLAIGLALAPWLLQVGIARADEEGDSVVGGVFESQAPDAAKPPLGRELGAERQAAATDEAEFTASFSNGAKVHLVGISENPSKGKAWWTPDGAPLRETPLASIPARMGSGLPREVCWRWTDLPEGPDVETNWGFEPASQGAGGGVAFDSANKRIDGLSAWAVSLPESSDTCTIKFSVSIGSTPWKTVFEANGRNRSATATTEGGVQLGAIFSQARAHEGGTSITVSYQLPNQAARLVAIDREGLLDVATSVGGGALSFTQKEFHFSRLSPDKIERYELQSQKRQFETIEFRNVSLHRDKRTKVEIARPGAEKRPDAADPAADDKNAAAIRYGRSTELIAKLADEFKYRLEEEEPLRRLPPPFSKERDELWALSSSLSITSADPTAAPARKEPVRPGYMTMQWTGSYLRPSSYHFSTPTLQQVLDSVFNVKLQDLQGDLRFVVTGVPGDWVVGWDPQIDHTTSANEVAVLERILRDELEIPVRLALRDVERPVYVVRGSYKFTPIPNLDGKDGALSGDVSEHADGVFQIPLQRTETVASAGSYQDFLHTIGEVILTPIVDEAIVRPAKESLFWRLHGERPKDFLAPYDEAQVAKLIESISKQTGLTFTKEKRAVPTLVLERDGKD